MYNNGVLAKENIYPHLWTRLMRTAKILMNNEKQHDIYEAYYFSPGYYNGSLLQE